MEVIFNQYISMELTLKEKWFKFWGFGYVVNHRPKSKEIHRLSSKHKNCHTDRIANREYVTRSKALKLIREDGYNGCRWCWKDVDKG